MHDYTLDEWVSVLDGRKDQPSPDYIVTAFPNEQLRKAYINALPSQSEESLRRVLRAFLGHSRTISDHDRLHFDLLKLRRKSRMKHGPTVQPGKQLSEYDRRLIAHFAADSGVMTWEGLTWVIDLLPRFPEEAIGAIQGYQLAHAQALPDLRLSGLADAVDLIRVRYIIQNAPEVEALVQLLLSSTSRDFEFLVARAYRSMGYEVDVTPAQKDGGKDIVARRSGEVLYIECKNWRGRVDSDVVAGLVGRVETHRVTRGIVIGTSGFTKGPASATAVAAESPARIYLIDGSELVSMFNASFGGEWHTRMERLLNEEKASQARIVNVGGRSASHIGRPPN